MVEDKKAMKSKMQNLILENRERLSISGVIDVISFNDESIIVETELGVLIIRGSMLKINKLSIDSSELSIEGEIVSCEYNDRNGARSRELGFFAKMFK